MPVNCGVHSRETTHNRMSPRARFCSCFERNLDLLFDTDLSGNVCKSRAHIKFNHPASISLLKRLISLAGFPNCLRADF